MKIVWIRWVDSVVPAENGWHKPSDLNLNPLVIESAGILVSEDKHQITLCNSMGNNAHITGVITVPKCAIKKRRLLVSRSP